jgi:hypothetical protein
MKEETCLRLLTAFDDIANVFGYSTFSELIDAFFKLVEQQAEVLKPIRTREDRKSAS